MKLHILIVGAVSLVLSGCGSLEEKSARIEVGSSRSDVASIMGSAPYKYTHEDVDAWRYAVVGGFGYCDYREFYIYRDVVILKNEYNRASIAGCTAGLKNIDWEPIFTAANEYDRSNPIAFEGQSNSIGIVEQLKDLNEMHESGALTDAEYAKAKEALLSK